MHTASDTFNRRQWLALAAASGLAACGGGDDSSAIVEFSADSPRYLVGQRATLTARFHGGSARIEPDIGAVQSGQPVQTPPLAASRSYRLVLSRTGLPDAVRELPLQVGWRNRWRALEQPFLVSLHGSCNTADGGVLVVGGSRGLSVLSPWVDRFDPATGRFNALAQMASGRAECSCLPLADGSVLVAGGQQTVASTAFAELIHPTSGQISHAGNLTQPRVRHAAVTLADGRVLLLGGLSRDSAELWDPTTRRWRLLASRMVHSREWPSATLLADGRVLVLGGGTPSAVFQFAELFDPRTELFLPLPLTGLPAQYRRYFHAAHRLTDGSVLVLGGNLQGDDLTPLASVLRIDVEGGHAVALTDLALPRSLLVSLRLPGDQVLMAGGETGSGETSADVTFYSPTTQQAAAPLPAPRAWHSMNLLPDGRVLLVGGENAAGDIASTVLLYD